MAKMDYESMILGLRKRIIDVEEKYDYLLFLLTGRNAANIDYVAMMTDVELPGMEDEEILVEPTEEPVEADEDEKEVDDVSED